MIIDIISWGIEILLIAFFMLLWMFIGGFVSIYVRIWVYNPSIEIVEKFVKELKSPVSNLYMGADGAPFGYPRGLKFIEVLKEFQAGKSSTKLIFIFGSLAYAVPCLIVLLILSFGDLLSVLMAKEELALRLILTLKTVLKVICLVYCSFKCLTFGRKLKF